MHLLKFTNRTAILLWICLAVGAYQASAQTKAKPLSWSVFMGGAVAEDKGLPFWLYANTYGTVDKDAAQFLGALNLESGYSFSSGLELDYGVELNGRGSESPNLFLNRGYLALSYGIFQLTAGRTYETIGLYDSTLSSGSLMQSSNTSPRPGISISTPRFVTVPGTGNFLQFKGYFSHSWLEKGRVVKNPYLHQKYLYLRLGFTGWPVHGYAGFSHNVTWGGTSERVGRLPQSFKDYVQVVLGQPADSTTGVQNEIGGTIGNTVAAYDVALEAERGPVIVRLSRQFYLEDRPGLAFRSPWDGSWGLSIHRKEGAGFIDGFLWEHVRTTRQGSKSFERRGADNYYNNSIYRSGWTYHGRTIGSPLLFAAGDRPGVANNIVVAHHFGLEGSVSEAVAYRAFVTYSRNYGQNGNRTPRHDQYSMMLEINARLAGNIAVLGTFALDTGEVYSNTLGMMAGIRYSGVF